MIKLLTRQEIGRRILNLRKVKGHSQAELARRLEISRPSLAQMELGNRNIDIFELQKLSAILGFSLDDFMSENFNTESSTELKHLTPVTDERISEPVFQMEKFKNILLYVLEVCAGKPNVNESFVERLLYFSDYNYYELYEEHLTGLKYIKLPSGPIPREFALAVDEMIKMGYLQRLKIDYNGSPQNKILPLVKASLNNLKASEKDVIDKVVAQLSDWSAEAVNQFCMKDIPLRVTKDGDIINYELALYREVPYSVRTYPEEANDI